MKMASVIASPRDFMVETPQICGFSCSLIHRYLAIWGSSRRLSHEWLGGLFISEGPHHGDLDIWIIELDDGNILTGKPYIWWYFYHGFRLRFSQENKSISPHPVLCSLSPRYPPDFMIQLPKPVEPGAVRMPLSPWLQYHKVGKLRKINLKVSH